MNRHTGARAERLRVEKQCLLIFSFIPFVPLLLCAFVPLFYAFGQEMPGAKEGSLEVKAFFSRASQANDYVKKGDYNQAIACYKQFLERYPRSRYSSLSYLLMAEIYRDYLHDYGQAVEMYKKVSAQPEGEDNLIRFSRKIAGKWKERVELAVIKQALNRYYAHDVEYPSNLRGLLLKGYLNEKYLVENNYFYRRRNSSLFPGLKGQEYTLYSSNLGKGEPSLSYLVKEQKAFSRQFSLRGLMEGPRGKKAVINYEPRGSSGEQRREILSEGESIGEAQVLEITGEGVILRGREELLVLTMGR